MALFCAQDHLPHEAARDQSSDCGKRKLEESLDANLSKRTKLLGPFIVDESDEEDNSTRINGHGPSSSNTKQSSWLDTIGTNCSESIEPHTGFLSAQFRAAQPPGRPFAIQSSFTISATRNERVTIRKCSGKSVVLERRDPHKVQPYEQLVASRSITAPGKATKSYYGIEIHRLLEEAQSLTGESKKLPNANDVRQSVETSENAQTTKFANALWTEKYRARRFKDLIGDDRTHRMVLRWLKAWDAIVFPGLAKPKTQIKNGNVEEPVHRKILLLTGPPGLGKTTLAHVCAKQAGYEVLEINASDERSKDVVKGRIKDAVGTENVKGVAVESDGKKIRKPGRPVCVVVDEVDGVVGGSGGGGEGGFMKALIDLVMLDQRNSNKSATNTTNGKPKKKGDGFRLLRPLILICNDVYHPSLRPLRTSSLAEIVHVRQVPLDQVVQRMKHVFQKEGVNCDGDAVRRICEASWGLSTNRDRQVKSRGISEGDIRGVLVAGEWIARKLRYGASTSSDTRLTRKWVDQHLLGESSKDGSIPGLGRGGTKEIAERVFIEGAGFPYDRMGVDSFKDPYAEVSGVKPVGVADLRKRHAITRLREMVDAAGEYDRCVTDCFLAYPNQTYQDDTILSKPNAVYEWLHFHDSASTRVYSSQAWELNPYLSQSVVAFHHLFSSTNKHTFAQRKLDGDEEEHPFSGLRADFTAFEVQKQNRTILTEFSSSLSAPLLRIFLSPSTIAMELVPNLMRILAPEIKPVIVGGSGSDRSIASVRKESEKALVQLAVRVMDGLGVTFEKTRVEAESGLHNGWVYRMEPALDSLTSFSQIKGTSVASVTSSGPVRYAVRQVLDQEYRKNLLKRQAESRQARYGIPETTKGDSNEFANGDYPKENTDALAKASQINAPRRDFFGRIIVNSEKAAGQDSKSNPAKKNQKNDNQTSQEKYAWVSYHEGFSNAVRKRITIHELLAGL